MFEVKRNSSTARLLFNMAELTFIGAVRKVRAKHGNAVMAIGISMMQSVVMVAAFYLMFSVLGTRHVAIRGDFMLYLISGIMMYMTHVAAVGAVMGAEGPASPMMQHAPMNTIVAILSSALSALYIQTITMATLLFIVHTVFTPVEIDQWGPTCLMFLLSWFSGCAVGMIFLALKPWFPDFINIARMIYVRANMIASGKMFVANMLPGVMIAFFDWNPLFHIIDQTRGFMFVNYFPHFTNWQYPIYISLAALMLGLMGEFYTRKRVSASWMAHR